MRFALRPYQEDGIAAIRAALKRTPRVIYQAPTGSGKGCMITFMTDGALRKGRRVCVVAHRRELTADLSKRLSSFGTPHGMIDASSRAVCRQPICVASVQTLARRAEHYAGQFDFLIVDEGHHCLPENQWGKCLALFPEAKVVAFSATPSRLDGRGLGDCFGELVIGPSVKSLIASGHLADFVAYAPAGGAPDLSGVKIRMGDYDAKQLAEAMESRKLIGDMVEHYRRHADGRRAVAFAVNVAHAEQVAQAFRDAGYRAVSVDGKLSDAERAERIRGLETGHVEILASCELISEGIDIPNIGAAILGRPTKSLNLYLQQVGRALRPKADGSRAVILDHAGNTMHGLPDAERVWSLDAKRKSREKAACPVRQCLSCYCVCPVGCRECPQCGEPFLIADRGQVETLAGTLVEVDRRFYGEDGRPTVERRRGDIEAALAKCASWDDIESLRKALGFKSGWSQAVAKNRGWLPIRNKAGFAFKYIPMKRAA